MASSSVLLDDVVVITGGSSGIGLATARAFARRGAKLVLSARGAEALQAAACACEALGAEVLASTADTTDEAAVQAVARAARTRFGRIDMWVNNAAVILFGELVDTPSEAWKKVVETNLFGYLHGAQAAIPIFREQGRGILVNIASAWGLVGSPFVSSYVASKFAVVGFSESLRLELAPFPDIHVCTLMPPSVDTPIYLRAGNVTGRVVGPVPPVYDADAVAETIVSLAASPRPTPIVGVADAALRAARRLSPRLAVRILGALGRRFSVRRALAPVTLGNLFVPKEPYAVSGGFGVLGFRRGRRDV